MATSSSRHVCSICLENFVKPKIIDCFHTFCLQCLEGLVEARGKNNQFVCPLCNRNINIPEGGLKYFSYNFYIEDQASTTEKTTEYCTSHPETENEFHCENCNISLCSQCVSTTHKGHTLRDMRKKRSELNEKFQAITQKLRNDTSKIKNHSDYITATLLEIQEFSARTSQCIDIQTEIVCGHIRKIAEGIKNEVKDCLQEDKTKLSKLLDDNERLKDKFTAITDVTGYLNVSEIQDEINKGRKLHDEAKTINVDIPVIKYPRLKEPVVKISDIKSELLGTLEICHDSRSAIYDRKCNIWMIVATTCLIVLLLSVFVTINQTTDDEVVFICREPYETLNQLKEVEAEFNSREPQETINIMKEGEAEFNSKEPQETINIMKEGEAEFNSKEPQEAINIMNEGDAELNSKEPQETINIMKEGEAEFNSKEPQEAINIMKEGEAEFNSMEPQETIIIMKEGDAELNSSTILYFTV